MRPMLAVSLTAWTALALSAQQPPAATPSPAKPASESLQPLAAFVGTFDQRTQVRVGTEQPAPSLASGNGRWIVSGQFVQIDAVSPPDAARRIETMRIYGYDPATKKYTLWSFETGAMMPTTATGDYDAATRTFTFVGEQPEGRQRIPFRWSMTVAADGSITESIAMKLPGSADFTPYIAIQRTPKPATDAK